MAFEAEQSAHQHAERHSLLEPMREVATRLETEARTTRDPQRRQRLTAVSAELWAMVGDLDQAAACLARNAPTGPFAPLLLLLGHQVTAAQGDREAWAAALEAETRALAPPEMRRHATLLLLDLERLKKAGSERFQQLLELSTKTAAGDPRPALLRLAQELFDSRTGTTSRWAPGPELRFMGRCWRDMLELRAKTPAVTADAASHPALVFRSLARALSDRKTDASFELLQQLAQIQGLAPAVRWLVACLAAGSAATRPKALEALAALAQLPNPEEALRATFERRVEQEGMAAVRAFADTAGSPDAPRLDRVDAALLSALAQLDKQEPVTATELTSAAQADPTLRPLLASLTHESTPSPDPSLAVGSDVARAEVMLGRALVVRPFSPERLDQAISAYASQHPASPLTPLLEIHRQHLAKNWSGLAETILDASSTVLPLGPGDREIAAALVRLLANDDAGMLSSMRQALEVAPRCETSVRALLGHCPAKAGAELLERLANSVDVPERRALLLLEAALRLETTDTQHAARMLEAAYEADPSAPLVVSLGVQWASRNGNVPSALQWIRRRADTLSDPLERALDSIREALLLTAEEPEQAIRLLEQAIQAAPDDYALRELLERLAPERGPTGWRRELVSSYPGAEQGFFLLWAIAHESATKDESWLASAALELSRSVPGTLVDLWAERVAKPGVEARPLFDRLLAAARQETDPALQRELYERLVRLEPSPESGSGPALWQSAALERAPRHLGSLRAVLSSLAKQGRFDELGPLATRLQAELPSPEKWAFAWLAVAASAQTKQGNQATATIGAAPPSQVPLGSTPSQSTPPMDALVAAAATSETPPLWALRRQVALARRTRNDLALLEAKRKLGDLATRAIDASTLALRASEAAMRLGRWEDTFDLMRRAVDLVPDHLVALSARAQILESSGAASEAAEAYDALAHASAVASHRVAAWTQAANLWLGPQGDLSHAETALELALEADPNHLEAAELLETLYRRRGELDRVCRLLENRAATAEPPELRANLLVRRAEVLIALSDASKARRCLEDALLARPGHRAAQLALAELAWADGDWDRVEEILQDLLSATSDEEEKITAYRRLARLYEQRQQLERAESVYREILRLKPLGEATDGLVNILLGRGDTAQALAEQQTSLDRAGTDEERRDRTLRLAQLYDEHLKDRRRAEQLLEKARRQWPQDGNTLRAMAEFHRRGSDSSAVTVLLDRALAEARRALGTGRYDPAFFDVIGTVAELRQDQAAAAVARATLAALRNEAVELNGIALAAANPEHDEVLAPEPLSLPLRALLRHTGHALCRAFPVDYTALAAVPVEETHPAVKEQARALGRGFGLLDVDLRVCPSLGAVVIPAASNPVVLLTGPAMLTAELAEVREFLLLRALKMAASNSSVFARTAPIDLWPMLAAYLQAFLPGWEPAGVEPKRLADARRRLAATLPSVPPAELLTLAQDVVGSIGNRASQLGVAVNQWGTRMALLAVGNPKIALDAVAYAAGISGVPQQPTERIKWISRNAEARDLTVFSVSEAYWQIRAQNVLPS